MQENSDKVITHALRLARRIAAGRDMPPTETVRSLAGLPSLDPVDGALRIAREAATSRMRLAAKEETAT